MENRTVEDYCRIILKLGGKGVHSRDVANALSVSKITVSLTVPKLAEKGLVKKPLYGRITLTKKGEKIAKKMNFRHRVLESFMHNCMKMGKAEVHKKACEMEHWIDDDFSERLYRFINRPKFDPHNREII